MPIFSLLCKVLESLSVRQVSSPEEEKFSTLQVAKLFILNRRDFFCQVVVENYNKIWKTAIYIDIFFMS